MHTNDPNGSGKCLRRDSDDEICGFQVGSNDCLLEGLWKASRGAAKGLGSEALVRFRHLK